MENCNAYGRKRSWPILRQYLTFSLRGEDIYGKAQSRESAPGRDSNTLNAADGLKYKT
jgi:hypothetical protein